MICLPASQEAVQPKPGKQRAVTFTSSEAASSTNKRQIATSDDENRNEDDEVEDMTNQKLHSKSINSVKRQKTKISDGEKASAPGKKEMKEREENDEDDEEEGGEKRRGG